MPALIAVLWGAFISIAGSLVKRVIIGLGFGVITFIGSKATVDWLLDQAVGKISGLPSDLLGGLNMAGMGSAISIIASAVTVRLVISGLNMVNDRAANLRFIGNKSNIWG